MKFLLRVLGSGGAVALLSLLFYLVVPSVSAIWIAIPGLIVGAPIANGLEQAFGLSNWLIAEDVDGPVFFAAVVFISGFVFWWAVAFFLWPFLFRRNPKAHQRWAKVHRGE